MIYLLGWVLCYCSLLVSGLTKYWGRAGLYIVLVFFASVAFFRGAVGTDTRNYEIMLSDFLGSYGWDGREPGFVALGWTFGIAFPTIELAVRGISLIFYLMLAYFIKRANKNEVLFLFAWFFPVFAYQYSMNGLRIGLASMVLLLIVQNGRLKPNYPLMRMGSLAALFHYSALISVCGIYLTKCRWISPRMIVMAGLSLAFLASGLVLLDFYIIEKINAYKGVPKPSPYAGLSIVIPMMIIFTGVIFGALPSKDKIKICTVGVFLLVLGVVITQFTYAGLRVLDLAAFLVPLALVHAYNRLNKEFDFFVRIALIGAGLLGALGIFRGFINGAGGSPTPFLPYETWIMG